MIKKNIVEFKVSGKYALFSDPLTRVGGEKFTYPIPTYQAIKGILESVYWKPTFVWVIDEIRVMNLIKTQSKGVKGIRNNTGNVNDLFIYTYLSNVEYQVKAHFEWNNNRENLKNDRNENKHFLIAKRMIERGGRRNVFLGTKECQAYVEPCKYGEGTGAYDNYGEFHFGVMFHGFNYPDETGRDELGVRFWKVKMDNGYVKFIRPNECTMTKKIRNMKAKKFINNENFCGLEEFNKEVN